MARTDNLTNFCEDVAESIRVMTGETGKIPAGEFDTKILSIETNEDLTEEFVVYDTELTEQETMLSDVSRTLHSQVSGGNLVKPHIFVQEEEPSVREGIWLKTSGITYDDIVLDNNVYQSGIWYKNFEFGKLPEVMTGINAAAIGDYIYILSHPYSNKGYKYNVKTLEFSFIATCPVSASDSIVVVHNTDIYICGGYSASPSAAYTGIYKYDTLADTYTHLFDLPAALNCGSGGIVGDNIYIIGGRIGVSGTASHNTIYKYDINTNTCDEVGVFPNFAYSSRSATVGSDIYIVPGRDQYTIAKNYFYKYDTLTGTFTQLKNRPSEIASLANLVAVGTKVYLFANTGNTSYAYTYDTTTGEYTKITNMPTSTNSSAFIHTNNKIYRLGGTSYSSKVDSIHVYSLDTSSYENNSLVFVQNDTMTSFLGTEVVTLPNFIGRLKYKFNDIFYYSTETGLDNTIPTYYGDGTKWVKFKN